MNVQLHSSPLYPRVAAAALAASFPDVSESHDAFFATRIACRMLAENPDEELTATTLDCLEVELMQFAHSFRVRRVPGHATVEIVGDDEGCVNEGVVLATCFLSADAGVSLFYWES